MVRYEAIGEPARALAAAMGMFVFAIAAALPAEVLDRTGMRFCDIINT